MRKDRSSKAVVLLVSVLFVIGGCSTNEGRGQSSGPSVSVGVRSTSSGAVPTRTVRPSTATARPIAEATVTTPDASYTQEEIDYFLEVALGTEYGDAEQTIKKWAEDIEIEVLGTPTEADLQTLEAVLEEINALIEGVDMVIVEQSPNVKLHFAPEEEFGSIEPDYVPTNYGFFWSYWNADGEFDRSRVLIATDGITQAERSHLIREEVTQVLGLMNDSSKYKESIFFEDWTETNSYAVLDKSVIEMLYREDIEPGMTAEEVIEVLEESK